MLSDKSCPAKTRLSVATPTSVADSFVLEHIVRLVCRNHKVSASAVLRKMQNIKMAEMQNVKTKHRLMPDYHQHA